MSSDDGKQSGNGNKGVEAVHNTAVSGKELAIVRYAVIALYGGCYKVAYLRNDGKHKSRKCKGKIICIQFCEKRYNVSVQKESKNRGRGAIRKN